MPELSPSILPGALVCCGSTEYVAVMCGSSGIVRDSVNANILLSIVPERIFRTPCSSAQARRSPLYVTMVSAGLVASCLALLAPARGFVRPIVTRTPGAEVRVFHVTARLESDSGRQTRCGREMLARWMLKCVELCLILGDHKLKLANMSFVVCVSAGVNFRRAGVWLSSNSSRTLAIEQAPSCCTARVWCCCKTRPRSAHATPSSIFRCCFGHFLLITQWLHIYD